MGIPAQHGTVPQREMPRGLRTKVRQKGKIKPTLTQAASTDIAALDSSHWQRDVMGTAKHSSWGVDTGEGILTLSAGHRGGMKSCHTEQQPPEMLAVVIS